MKNKTGKLIGFILGVTTFLLLFKVLVLDNTNPADELAPGMVVIAAVINGVLFGFIGNLLQNRLGSSKLS